MGNLLRRLVKEDHGAETLEYALIMGLIVVGVIGIIGVIGTHVKTRWANLNGKL